MHAGQEVPLQVQEVSLQVNAGALGHALGPSMLGRFDVDGVANR